MVTANDYEPSHCWYYHLKGEPLYLKAILERVISNKYYGYMEEKIRADAEHKTKGMQNLLSAKEHLTNELKNDIAKYRKYLVKYARARNAGHELVCIDLGVALSLKFCHIYNGFGGLRLVDQLLDKPAQADLFGY